MVLEQYRQDFYTYSGKASDVSRQLAFAAIAVIWLFKKDAIGQPSIPSQLFLPGVLIISALALDLLHYCWGAITWYAFYRSKEKAHVPEDAKIKHSTALVWPLSALFCLKIIFVMVAYFFILKYLLTAVGVTGGI